MDQFEDLIIKFLEQVFSSQEEFSDEELEMLFEVAQEALSFIKERKEAPIESAVPQVPASEYPSSNVNGMKYNPDTQELLVQFHGPYPQAEGSIYKFSKVPQFLFEVLRRGAVGPKTSGKNAYHTWIRNLTPSLGGSFNALIKQGGFEYEKVA